MLLSENVQLGLGKESTRGTGVAPSHWVRGRVPTSIKVVNEKTMVKESKGTRASSQDSIITAQRVEGDFEFNLRNATVGYFLLSLLGSVSTAANADTSGNIYDHTFSVDVDEPQAPSLTLAVARGQAQHYQYPLVLVSSFELNAVQGDLVYAMVNFIGKTENEVADYTPAWPSDDHIFTRENVSIKIADDVASLSGASNICVKELSLNIMNNARPKLCLSSLTPEDIIALMIEVSGNLSLDFEDKTYYDIFKSGASKAMEITIENGNQTIGDAANPKMVITLPKITFENYSDERAIDEIVSEGIDFNAHYSDADSSQISVVLTNEESSY